MKVLPMATGASALCVALGLVMVLTTEEVGWGMVLVVGGGKLTILLLIIWGVCQFLSKETDK